MDRPLYTRISAGPPGWYWTTHPEEPFHGPFPTRLEASSDAMLALENASEGEGFTIHNMRRPSITTDIFDAGFVLEELEDANNEAVWADNPPDWPRDYERRNELEKMLADTLRRWLSKHNLAREFRSLEAV